MIIYTDKTLKNWMGGRQFWFFAVIRPSNRGKQDIVEHEKEHIKQWWLTTVLSAVALAFAFFVANKHLGATWQQWLPLIAVPPSLHGLLYLMFRQYRQWAEVRAYRVSLAYRPDSLDYYAQVLATKYKLNITVERAKELLK